MNILVVEDSQANAIAVAEALRQGGIESQIDIVQNPAEMRAALSNQAWQAVIASSQLLHFHTSEALSILKESGQNLPFVVIAEQGNLDHAVSLIKAGADDYILKEQIYRLPAILAREILDATGDSSRNKQSQENHPPYSRRNDVMKNFDQELQTARGTIKDENLLLARTKAALRESEARFRGLVEMSRDAVILEVDGKISFINPAGLALLGANFSGELIGTALIDRIHPRFHETHLQQIEKPDEVQISLPAREEICLKIDGSPVEVETSVRPIFYKKHQGLLFLFRDITERRKIESTILENQQFYKILFDHSPLGIALWVDNKVAYANPKALEMFGYEQIPEIIGRPVDDFVLSEITESGNEKKSPSSPYSQQVMTYDFLAKQQSGQTFDALVQTAQINLNENRLFLTYISDISRRKDTERLLDRYRALAENTQEIMYFLRYTDKSILEANPAACKAYGYSPEEFSGLNISHIRAPHLRNEIDQQIDHAILNGEKYETIHIRRNGEQFPVEVSLQSVTLAGDKVLLSVVRDLSERKRAERELYQQIEENQKKNEELEVLVEISSKMRSIQNYQEMITLLVDQSVKVMGADYGILGLIQEDRLIFNYTSEAIHEWQNTQLPQMENQVWEFIHQGNFGFVENGLIDLHKNIGDISAQLMPHFSAGIIAPLKSGNAPIGVLMLGYQTPQKFSSSQKRTITAIAELAGNALNRMNTTDAMEKLVAERTRDLNTIYQVAAAVTTATPLDIALQDALEAILSATHAQRGLILLYDEASQSIKISAQKGFPSRLALKLNDPEDQDSIEKMVIRSHEPFISSDVLSDPRLKFKAEVNEAYAFAGLPVMVKDRLVGVLEIARLGGEPYDRDEISFLSGIADHLALAIENANLMHQAEQKAIFEERYRLGRELHDSVTQLLYSATLFAEGGRRLFEKGNQEAAKDSLVQVGKVTHQALKEMRLMIYELRSTEQKMEGLAQAIQKRLDAVEIRAGVQVHFSTDKLSRLPVEVEHALYSIITEALNNSLKHSSARQVSVEIRKRKGNICVKISDDGLGFDPSGAAGSGGMGLSTMQERAVQMGGRVEICTRLGGGTEVDITVPLKAKTHHQG
jgi:PAS domain S-box-containing protein